MPTDLQKIVEMYILRGVARRFLCKYNIFYELLSDEYCTFSVHIVCCCGRRQLPVSSSHLDELNLAI